MLGFASDTPARVRWQVAAVLAVAVTAISSSAVLVRGMEADPLAIAAWRTLAAAILLSPSLRGLRTLEAREWASLSLAGALLGLHFWTWFASVGATTVLRATLLVCTVPIWTALAEWLTTGRAPTSSHWLGLGIAFPGLFLLAGEGGRSSMWGDALALFAAVLWAGYFLLTRDVRQRLSSAATMAIVCAAASVVLFSAALVTDTPLVGFPRQTWGLIGLAVLGPQLLGHLGFVFAVRWVSATTVSVVTLLEPVGAAMLAAMVLGETPGPLALAGSALVLAGTAVAARG